MKQVQKSLIRLLILSLILSAALVAGIPVIVFGAANELWILTALGIVCTAGGFFGTPIAWTAYGELRGLARLTEAVVEEHIYTVRELAVQLSISEKEARKRLNKCFQKRYLPGYRREGDNIILNEGRALEKRQFSAECPNCGAKFSYTRENPRCPYCNSPVQQN